jgi:hypothetical protein
MLVRPVLVNIHADDFLVRHSFIRLGSGSSARQGKPPAADDQAGQEQG